METLTIEELPAGGHRTLGNMMLRMMWREAYHLRQTEILRQLAAKHDRVL